MVGNAAIGQQFIRIHRQAPVIPAIGHQQEGQPVQPEAGGLVARGRLPERDIGLLPQHLCAAIITAVFDDQEVPDAEAPVIVQEIRQPRRLVAQHNKGQNVLCPDCRGLIAQQAQLVT